MSAPAFRFVAAPGALRGTPAGWASEMLRDGEVALLAGAGVDLADVSAVAGDLDRPAIQVLRQEVDAFAQDRTVISFGAQLPLVWVATEFNESARAWAQDRGPMTLLVVADGPLAEDERRRIDRFVAMLGRQSE